MTDAPIPQAPPYPARLRVDHPDHDLDRLTTLLRIFWIIPIAIVLALVTNSGGGTVVSEQGERVRES